MATLFGIVKSVVLALIRFGIAYVVCFYMAHFTESQSVVVSIVGLCAFDGYRVAYGIAAKQKLQFEPFWVRIQPDWYSICRDFGLAAGERWKELQETSKAAPAGYSVLRDGFNFTMLSPTLFYSNDHFTFFGDLDFKIPIEELRTEQDRPFSFAPQFYVKRTLAGEKRNLPVIEFGIITQDSLKKSFHPADDNANVPVARLPEVVLYHRFGNRGFAYDRGERSEKERELRLAEYGWTRKERDPENLWLHWPFEINNKYLRVTYRGIS
jgi:hypothetical protein